MVLIILFIQSLKQKTTLTLMNAMLEQKLYILAELHEWVLNVGSLALNVMTGELCSVKGHTSGVIRLC